MIYITSYKIGHKRKRKYWDQNLRCIIGLESHKLEDNWCRVTKYHKEKEKWCIYVNENCANYRRGHSAHSNQYTQRYKVEVDIRRNNLLSKGKAKMNEVSLNLSNVSLESKARLESDNSSKAKASLSLDQVISDPDTEIDLVLE